MVLDAASTSRILSSRRSETTTRHYAASGADQPGIAACGTSAILCAVASLQISETSAVDPAQHQRRLAVKQVAFLVT